MMLVRFDSQYSVIEPGRGFLLTVTAAPSGKTLLNAIEYIWIAWKCFFRKIDCFQDFNNLKFYSFSLHEACISSPCKYPATCKDGLHSDEYTCSCTEGYSGTICDTVACMSDFFSLALTLYMIYI